MKKILALAFTAVFMASSTFALGLGAGVRGFLGTNFNDANSVEDAFGELKQVNLNSALDFGAGAYVNANLIGGLGVQAEANLLYGTTKLSSAGDSTKYSTWNLDIPVMLWLSQDIGNFQIGLGAGPNFELTIPTSDFQGLYKNVAADFKDNAFKVGAAFGVDLKYYINDHFGIVLGGRYMTDFSATETPVQDLADGDDCVEFTRKSAYGNIGAEFKLF